MVDKAIDYKTMDKIANDKTPQDIKKEWLSLIRRFQSVASTNGYAIVSMQVLVDRDGIPVSWLEPTVTKIEPKTPYAALFELFKAK